MLKLRSFWLLLGLGVLLLAGAAISRPRVLLRLDRLVMRIHPPPAIPKGLIKAGDLVFQMSRSGQSAAVALATHSRFTHMGIVEIAQDGNPVVLEAVQPVRRTPLEEWAARGVGGHVWVRRLRDAATVLTPSALERMHSVGDGFVGRPYDLQFQWEDGRLYCSELAFKVYERGAGIRIGALQRAGDMDLASPAVQAKIKQRFGPGATFNPDEPVITPQAMFEDSRLVTVFER
jgi:hypothetical protein